MIGCGSMASYHGRRFMQEVPEAQIVALADPSERSIADFKAKVFQDGAQPEGTFADYREMLSQVPLDGVVIVTPHAYHFQQAMDAISAGCHVLVEKPMVVNTQDAQKLIQHARDHDRVVSISFQGPHTREFKYARDVIARGDLGELSLITGVCAQPWISGTRGTWRAQPELSGGGNLYDSGAHMFNAMLYLTGLAATDVFAFINNKGEQVDVSATVSIRFTEGALGSAAVSGDASVFEQGIYIQGTRGAIKTSIYGGGTVQHWQDGKQVENPELPPGDTPQHNFVDCILHGASTATPPLLGLRQARLMDAIYESARTGAPVSVVADEA
jgi:predicted dehydrogenase